jgi:hypothetical protein
MDLGSLFFNLGTLVASVIALIVSSITATRQSRLAWNGNHVPLLNDFLGTYRSKEIRKDEMALWASLEATSHPTDSGFASLPEDLRTQAYTVCMYYQIVSYLVFYEMLDEDLAFLYLHFSLDKTWTLVSPYVYAERHVRGDPYSFFNAFEELSKVFSEKKSDEVFVGMIERYKSRRHRSVPYRRGTYLGRRYKPGGRVTLDYR